MKRIADTESVLRNMLRDAPSRCAFLFAIEHYWLNPASMHDVAVFAESSGQIGALRLVVTDDLTAASACDASWPLQRIADELNAALIDLAQPLSLLPLHIPKPWGQEVWFTGVEARGVCQFGQRGRWVPIPWIVQICGSLLRGFAADQLVLLKILDPLPEEVFGDLYVELHEKKQEVYVVTQVDKTAWPDGIGSIRFGFNQQKRGLFYDDQMFKKAYLAAVRRYRDIRVAIDQRLDAMRTQAGVALDAPVSANQQKSWLATVAPDLAAAEQTRRQEMDSFYGQLPLKPGDVIKVPCFVPHSLQHGVRTIEFQTPVYERMILSFAQKVLTQSFWDTEQAMSMCGVGPVQAGELELLRDSSGVTVERIVDFDSFEVFRVALAQGARLELDSLSQHRDYAVVMTVSGHAQVMDHGLLPAAAILLPYSCADWVLKAVEGPAVTVVAIPKTPALC